MVYGGGVYDGRINTDLVHDSNMLYRPFSLSLWHNAPREVLMIGLATGAWAQVIANHPQVEKLTIVEINPGYLKLIREVRGGAQPADQPQSHHRDRRRTPLAGAQSAGEVRRGRQQHVVSLARAHAARFSPRSSWNW